MQSNSGSSPTVSKRNPIAEWAGTILILLFASTSVAWAYVVPTGSMEKTVLVGDHIIVDKLAYSQPGPVSRFLLPYETPKHGDVIVFKYPVNPKEVYVKRLIGLPGDRIKIVDQQVFLNGVALQEPYVWHSLPYVTPFQQHFPPAAAMTDTTPDERRDGFFRDMLEHHVVNGEVVVPADSYFAMGDNRQNSLDSRYWGFVPKDNMIGRPVLIYWSYEATEDELVAGSGTDMARHMLDLGEHFFTRTRWNRTFHLIRGYSEAN